MDTVGVNSPPWPFPMARLAITHIQAGGVYSPTSLMRITPPTRLTHMTLTVVAFIRNMLVLPMRSVFPTRGGPESVGDATITDALGTIRTWQYVSVERVPRISSMIQPNSSGSGTSQDSSTYDTNGNLSIYTDFNGTITKYFYDLTRNLETSRIEAYGTSRQRTISTQWNTTWRKPSLITDPNRTTGFTYNALGNALTKTVTDTSVTPNVVRTWTYTYDGYGRMLTAVGPRSDVVDKTTYIYYTCTTGYQCGQVNTMSNALNQVTTFLTYNAHGQPLTIADPNGVLTTLTYDARQRLTSRQVSTELTSYTFYPTGLLKLVTLPDSSTVLYAYDGAHRLTDITDTLGNHVHYTLDAMGNHTA